MQDEKNASGTLWFIEHPVMKFSLVGTVFTSKLIQKTVLVIYIGWSQFQAFCRRDGLLFSTEFRKNFNILLAIYVFCLTNQNSSCQILLRNWCQYSKLKAFQMQADSFAFQPAFNFSEIQENPVMKTVDYLLLYLTHLWTAISHGD